MVKKEFTDETLRNWDNLSDVELIELLAKGTHSTGRLSSIEALLDRRLKRSINHLKEITEKSIVAQDQYSNKLVRLTSALVILTWVLVGLSLVITIATIVLLLRG
jgi:hypothetical protein